MVQVHHAPPPLPNDPFPLVRHRGTALLDERLSAHWAEADLMLDAHIAALHMWTRDVTGVAPRSRVDWCVASLQEIQDCLSRLSAVVMGAHASGLGRAESPLVQYVTEAYVWTGDVMQDVLALVRELRSVDGGPAKKRGRSIEEESAYVTDFLDPLYRELVGLRSELEVDPVLRQVLPLAAGFRAAIVGLEEVLRTNP
jgi:hypothetical protein